jgi:penicillin-binding protein 2
VYFYTGGDAFWQIWRNGDEARGLGLQNVARELGFEQPTGIELSESTGRIADPAWKKDFAAKNYKGVQREQNEIWYPADNIFTAVGQGDSLVTPLQLANAYACFANGGTLWTPHVGGEIRDAMTKNVVRRIEPKARQRTTFDPYWYGEIRGGFEQVVSTDEGTANVAFNGLPIPVAGKTGTAEVPGKGPTSLFAGYFPANAPEYVALAVVDEGGYGSDVAAPIVRQVVEAMYNLPPTPIRGESVGRD